MSTEKSNGKWAIAFSMASVWFCTSVGGGFASGTMITGYFNKYGWFGVLTCIVSCFLLGWCVYWAWEVARISNCHNYKDWSKYVYYPLDKIVTPVFDIVFLILIPIVVGSCIAGAGQVMTDLFGLNYTLSCAAITALVLFLVTFGNAMVRRASKVMTFFLLITLGVTIVIIVTAYWQPISDVIINQKMGEGYTVNETLMKGFFYTALQMGPMSACVAASDIMKTKGDSFRSTMVGLVMTVLGTTGACLMLYAQWPANCASSLPTLDIVRDYGNGILILFYSVSLFLAFLSTATTYVYAQSNRYAAMKLWDKLKPENPFRKSVPLRCFTVGLLWLIYAFALSNLGLNVIVNHAYKYLHLFWTFLLALPLIIYAPIRCKIMEKEIAEYGEIRSKHTAE